MTYIFPFIFTFMAYSPPYFSVNGMMILFLAYKNGFKSQLMCIMAFRKIPFCLWHIVVGLLIFIFLFMAYRCRATHIYISVYCI